jgi:transcriptional regulator with XRE-family HTH domain
MDERVLLTNLGVVIKRTRVEIGLSQEELADKAELHRTYISDIESGRRNISMKLLCRVARALNLETWELLRQAET